MTRLKRCERAYFLLHSEITQLLLLQSKVRRIKEQISGGGILKCINWSLSLYLQFIFPDFRFLSPTNFQ